LVIDNILTLALAYHPQHVKDVAIKRFGMFLAVQCQKLNHQENINVINITEPIEMGINRVNANYRERISLRLS